MKTAALASVTASVQKAECPYNPAESVGFNGTFRQQVRIIMIFYVLVATACNFSHFKLQYFPRHFRLKGSPYILFPSHEATDFTPTKFTKQ
jgi:hypothetical protein